MIALDCGPRRRYSRHRRIVHNMRPFPSRINGGHIVPHESREEESSRRIGYCQCYRVEELKHEGQMVPTRQTTRRRCAAVFLPSFSRHFFSPPQTCFVEVPLTRAHSKLCHNRTPRWPSRISNHPQHTTGDLQFSNAGARAPSHPTFQPTCTIPAASCKSTQA